MDKALTVRFICLEGTKLAIEMGEAKWVDKGAVMAVSMFVLWPLAITAVVGIYRQKQLPKKIIAVADAYLGKENRMDSAQENAFLSELTEKINAISHSTTVQKIVAESDKIMLIVSKLIR